METESTSEELVDYTVGDVFILDIVRGRWSFPDLLREVEKAYSCHRPRSILVDDHGSGIGLVQTLKERRLPIVGVKPKGDKVMRMHAHTATLEAGKIFVKSAAPWLDELRGEVLAFTYGRHDDQIDALSQLLTWDADRRTPKASIRDLNWRARR